MMKQTTLAALTALFVISGAGMASAEGSIGTAASDEGSSAWMEADYAATHGNGYVTVQPRASLREHAAVTQKRAVIQQDNEGMTSDDR